MTFQSENDLIFEAYRQAYSNILITIKSGLFGKKTVVIHTPSHLTDVVNLVNDFKLSDKIQSFKDLEGMFHRLQEMGYDIKQISENVYEIRK